MTKNSNYPEEIDDDLNFPNLWLIASSDLVILVAVYIEDRQSIHFYREINKVHNNIFHIIWALALVKYINKYIHATSHIHAYIHIYIAQSAGAVEYTEYIAAVG